MSWRRMRSGLIAPAAAAGVTPVAFISGEVVYTGTNTSGSGSITVPANCDCAVLVASATENNTADIWPSSGIAINSVDMTKSAHVSGDAAGDYNGCHAFYVLTNPAIGSQTLDWAFGDVSGGDSGGLDYGATWYVAYFRNVDPTVPVSSTDTAANNGAANAATPLSVSATANDMTLHLIAAFPSGAEESHSGATVIYSDEENSSEIHFTCKLGETAPGHNGGASYMAHSAIVLSVAA